MLGSVSELGVGCRLDRACLVEKVVLADDEVNSIWHLSDSISHAQLVITLFVMR